MSLTNEVTPADLDRLMELLKEYTYKLREICEEIRSNRFRQMLTIALMGGGTLLVPICFIAIINSTKNMPSFEPLFIAASFIVIMPVCLMIYVYLNKWKMSRSVDTEQVAATVKRIIKLASQYQEHSKQNIGERFEFELRLAEAEGALEVYYKMTNQEKVFFQNQVQPTENTTHNNDGEAEFKA